MPRVKNTTTTPTLSDDETDIRTQRRDGRGRLDAMQLRRRSPHPEAVCPRRQYRRRRSSFIVDRCILRAAQHHQQTLGYELLMKIKANRRFKEAISGIWTFRRSCLRFVYAASVRENARSVSIYVRSHFRISVLKLIVVT